MKTRSYRLRVECAQLSIFRIFGVKGKVGRQMVSFGCRPIDLSGGVERLKLLISRKRGEGPDRDTHEAVVKRLKQIQLVFCQRPGKSDARRNGFQSAEASGSPP